MNSIINAVLTTPFSQYTDRLSNLIDTFTVGQLTLEYRSTAFNN